MGQSPLDAAEWFESLMMESVDDAASHLLSRLPRLQNSMILLLSSIVEAVLHCHAFAHQHRHPSATNTFHPSHGLSNHPQLFEDHDSHKECRQVLRGHRKRADLESAAHVVDSMRSQLISVCVHCVRSYLVIKTRVLMG